MSKAEIKEEVQKQFIEEYGIEVDIPDHKLNHRLYERGNQSFRTDDPGCPACRAHKDASVLRQKYGLMVPQPYQGKLRKLNGADVMVNETKVIDRERRKLAKDFTTALMGGRRVSVR